MKFKASSLSASSADHGKEPNRGSQESDAYDKVHPSSTQLPHVHLHKLGHGRTTVISLKVFVTVIECAGLLSKGINNVAR